MCTMCGCGEAGNMGDMKSPDMPMMTVGDMFGGNQSMSNGITNTIHVTPDVPGRTGMESVGTTKD